MELLLALVLGLWLCLSLAVAPVLCRPHVHNHCKVNDIQVQEAFDLQKFAGRWYDVARLDLKHDSIRLQSGVSQYEIKYNSDIGISYSGAIDGRCAAPLTASGWQQNGAKLVLSFENQPHGFLRGPFWVASTDYVEYAVVYGCYQTRLDGSCHQHHQLVYVIGRRPQVAPHVREKIDAIIRDQLCVDPTSLTDFKHHRSCPLPGVQDGEYSMQADAGGVLEDEPASTNDCKVEDIPVGDIPVHAGLDLTKFVGRWYVLATYSSIGMVIPSGNAIMELGPDNTIHTYFTGSRPSGTCFPTFRGTMRPVAGEAAASMYANYGQQQGPLHIVYMNTDYTYGVTYQCSDVAEDGHCGRTTVDVIGRTKELGKGTSRAHLIAHLGGLCLGAEDFHKVSHQVDCEAEIYRRGDCRVADFRTEQHMDWQKLSGLWHTVSTLHNTGVEGSSWFIRKRYNDQLTITYVGARGGQCQKPVHVVAIPDTDGTGDLELSYGKVKGNGKVVYTDYDLAVYYECEHVQEDGRCEAGAAYVEVLRRSLDTPTALYMFDSLIDSLCVETPAMHSVPHAVKCEVDTRCRTSDIPVFKDLDLVKFAGRWRRLAMDEPAEVDEVHYLLLETDSGGLSVYTETASAGECGPTHRSSSLQAWDGYPGQFTVNYGRFLAEVRIVWTDYTYALIYECSLEEDGGTCAEGHEQVEAIAREDVHVSDDFLTLAKPYLSEVCRLPDDMHMLSQQDPVCEIERATHMIRIDELPQQKNLKLQQLLGTWYRHASSSSIPGVTSLRSKLIQVDENSMQVVVAGASAGTCFLPRTFVSTAVDGYVDWIFEVGRFHGHLRVLYNDDQNSVMYFCTRTSADGTCVPGHISLGINSRSKVMNKQDVLLAQRYVREAGFDPEQLIPTPQDVDCSLDVEVTECKLADLPVLQTLDKQQISGTWYPVMRVIGSSTPDSTVCHLSANSDGSLTVLYTGAWQGKCFSTMRNSLVQARGGMEGSLVVNYGQSSGAVRIVYASAAHMLIHECSHETPDGRCLSGEVSVEVWSRDATVPINDKLKEQLMNRIRDLCVDPELMQDIPRNEECELQMSRACKVADMPTQQYFDVHQMMGKWYIIGSLRGSGSWDSGVVTFSLNVDGTVEGRHGAAKRGRCLPVVASVLKPVKESAAEWKDDSGVLLKVVSTDYNHALVYECDQVNEDGTCAVDQVFVDVLSRTQDPLPRHVGQRFIRFLQQICFHQTEFDEIPHTTDCDLSGASRCRVADLPVQENFQPDQLNGEWKTVARLKDAYAVNSGRYSIAAAGHGTFSVLFTGARNGKCLPTGRAFATPKPQGKPGEYHIAYDNYQGDLVVLYSGATYLMLYECYRRSSQGHCSPEHTYIELLSRDGNLEDTMEVQLAGVAKKACFDVSEFVRTSYDVACEIQKSFPCKMDAMPLAEDLTVTELLGTWYSTARLSGSQVEQSGVLIIENVEASRDLSVRYASAIAGVCQTFRNVFHQVQPGSAAEWQTDFAGRIRVTHASARYLILYECSQVSADGSCQSQHVYVDVYSRTRDPPSAPDLEVLGGVIRRMCLNPDDFVYVSHDLRCQVKPLTTKAQCKFSELPSQPNFNPRKNSGTWYEVARLSGIGVVDSRVLRLRDAGDGDLTVLWTGARRGKCQPTARVRASPADGEDYTDLVVAYDGEKSRVKVLYTDYKHSLVYECMPVSVSDRCDPSKAQLVVYARTRQTPGEDVMARLLPVARQACFDEVDFKPIPHHVHCEVDASLPERCGVQNIPTQQDFQVSQILGTWYHTFRLRGSATWDAGIIHFERNQQQQLRAFYAYSVNGACSPSNMAEIHQSENNPAIWHFDDTAYMKVMYADDHMAVVYECDQVTEELACVADRVYLDVLMRHRNQGNHALTEQQLEVLGGVVHQACFEPGDFIETDHSVDCPLRRIGCTLDDLPTEPHFDLAQVTGTWYTMARLKGSGEIDSGVQRLRASSDRSYVNLYTGSKDGSCLPTMRMQMEQHDDSSPADLFLSVGEQKGLARVMFTDYQHLLMYTCMRFSEDGQRCATGYDNVVVYSRTKSLPESVIARVTKVIHRICFTVDDFEYVPHDIQCDLVTLTPDKCLVNNVLPPANTDFGSLEGRWYSMFLLRGSSTWDSSVVEYQAMDNGDVKVWMTGSVYGECPGTRAAILRQTDTPGSWTLRLGHSHTGYVKVLHVDGDHLMVYQCDEVLDSGACAADRVYVDVLSRSQQAAPVETIVRLAGAARSVCFEPGDFAETNHQVSCELLKHDALHCTVDDLPAMHDINVDQVSGTWHGVYRLVGSSIPDSSTFKLHPTHDGTVTMLYTGAVSGHCFPTDRAVLHDGGGSEGGQPGTFTATFGDGNVAMRLLYGDDDHLLLYECGYMLEDGTCEPGSVAVGAYSRTLTIPDAVQQAMLGSAIQACFTTDDFEAIPQQDQCKLQTSTPEECRLNKLKVQTDFDVTKFVGTWFSRFRLRGSTAWESGTVHFEILAEDSVKAYYSYSSGEQCHYTALVMQAGDQEGHAYYRVGQYTAHVKVTFTDYTYAMLVECSRVSADGTCPTDQVFVDVLSRNLADIPSADLPRLRQAAWDICLEPGDFQQTSHNVECGIQLSRGLNCLVDELPLQRDFSSQQFTGTWYAVARLQGSDVLDSAVMRIQQMSEDTWSVLHTGARRGECLATSRGRLTFRQVAEPADLLATYGDIRGHVRVLSTDYQHALVYECYQEAVDGSCQPGYGSIVAYSRTPQLTQDAMDKMTPLVKEACHDVDDFELVPHDVTCAVQISTPAECKVRNIPAQDNFDKDRFLGKWHSLYRLQGTYLWESFTAFYETTEQGDIQAYYAGSIGDTCQPTLMFTFPAPTSGRAILRSQVGDMEDVSRVMYTDYDRYTVMHTCDQVLEDGTCAADHVYVDVLGRELKEPPPDVVDSLIQLVRKACFEPGDFMETSVAVQCEPSREISRSCKITDMPVVKHFDSQRISGLWYSLARFRGATVFESATVLIQAGRSGQLEATVRAARKGRCLRAETEVLKPTGSADVADFTTTDGATSVRVRVLYTDYQYVLIVRCYKLNTDGTCADGYGEAVVYGRDSAATMDDAVTQQLTQAANQACLSEEDFQLISHTVDCEVRRVACDVDDLPAQEAFDIYRFTGSWHVVARLKNSGSTHSSALSIRISGEDSFVAMLTEADEEGECLPAERFQLSPIEHTVADLYLQQGRHKGYARVLYTDYSHALLYMCRKADDDHKCDFGDDNVIMLSRTKDVSDQVIKTMVRLVYQACFTEDDFEWVSQQVECAAGRPKEDRCKVANLPRQTDLDFSSPLGTWYSVFRLRGSATWESGVTRYELLYNGNMKVFYTASSHGECGATYASVLYRTESPAIWRLSFGSHHAHVQILHSDERFAVLYQCDEVLSTGHCAEDRVYVDVMTHTLAPVTQDDIKMLSRVVGQACFVPGDFAETSHEVECKITKHPAFQCKVSDLPAQDDLHLGQFSGTWRAVYRLHGTGVPDSAMLRLKLNAAGGFSALVTGSVSGACLPTGRAEYRSLDTSGSQADWVVDFAGYKGHLRVLYTDYEHALVYECGHELEDGTCSPGEIAVTAFSRTDSLPDAMMSTMLELVEAVCFTADDFQLVSHDVPCMLQTQTSPECRVDKVMSQQDFQLTQIVGTWYSQYRLRGSTPWESGTVHFKVLSQQYVRAHYAYSSGSECLYTTTVMASSQDDPATWTYRAGQFDAVVKVLYADADYAVIVECGEVLPDKTCAMDSVYADVLSRRRSKLPSEDLPKLRDAVGRACFEAGDFGATDHSVHCEVHEAVELNCRVDEMPLQADFDMAQFTGTWYAVAKLIGSDVSDSGVLQLRPSDEDSWNLLFTGSRRGKCLQTGRAQLTLREAGEPADLLAMFAEVRGRNRVLYSDYQVALVYECYEEAAGGLCAPGQETIVAYSRTRQLEEATIERLVKVAGHACYQRDDFDLVPQEVECGLATKTATECKVRNIPSMDFLDIDRFLGTWYSLYRLRGSYVWDSLVIHYERTKTNDIIGYYGGSKEGACQPTFSLTFSPPEGGRGVVRATVQGAEVLMKLMYTDYEHYAVVYSCDEVLADGLCAADKVYVDVLSRELKEPSQDSLDQLKQVVDQACFEEGDFFETNFDVECELSRKLSRSCRLNTMPVVSNFDASQFTGVWYSYAKFRGTTSLDSVSMLIQSDRAGHLEAVLRGARNEVCLTSVTLDLVASGEKGLADFTVSQGAYQGRVRILYTDYRHALIVECTQEREDGTCAPGHGSAVVYSRKGTLPEAAQTNIIQTANEACLSEDDFSITEHAVECELRRVGCTPASLPAQKDFDIHLFTGTWYTVARLRNSGTWDSGVMTIRSTDQDVFTALIGGAQGGECLPVLRVQITRYLHSSQADLFLAHGESKALARVMYTDYKHALLYMCEHFEEDTDTCSPGSDNVLVYSRTRTLPDSAIHDLVKTLHTGCLSESDFEYVPHDVTCSLDKATPAQCNVHNLKGHQDLDVPRMMGRWYSKFSLRGSAAVESGVADYQLLDNGDIKVYHTSSWAEECLDTEAHVLHRTEDPARWTVTYGHQQGYVKILYTCYDHLVVYQCDRVLPDGTCPLDAVYLDVLSRDTQAFDDVTVAAVSRVIRAACFQPGDMSPTSHEVQCSIKRHRSFDCQLEDLPSQADFDSEKFSGTWYGIFRLHGSGVPDSLALRLRSNEDGTFTALYTGARLESCLATSRATFVHKPGTADFTASYGEEKADTRVLYTDYDHALVYECGRVLADGTCAPGYVSVIVYSHTLDLNQTAIVRMVQAADSACLASDDFEHIPHKVRCELQVSTPAQCKMAAISAQSNLDVSQLSGRWFSIYRLTGSSTWEAGSVHFETLGNDVRAYYAFSHDGKCQGVNTVLHHTSHRGEWTVLHGHHRALLKIVYTDYQYLVLYECGEETSDGGCAADKLFVNVLSRSRQPPPEQDLPPLIEAVRAACLEPADFTETVHHEECEIQRQRALQCSVDDLPIVDDFQPDKFTGTWYEVARVRGSDYTDSAVLRIRKVDAYTWTVLFTSSSRGVCQPTERGQFTLHEAGLLADMYTTFGAVRGRVRVLYTDYQTAMVYECASEACTTGQGSVVVYSRTKQLQETTVADLVPIAHQACFEQEDFELTPHDVECEITTTTPVQCKVRNIPDQNNFDIEKFLGTWFSIYGLRGSHAWDNFVAHYERTLHGDLVAYYTGARGGQCEPTILEPIEEPRDGQASWTHTSPDGHTSVVRIIYTDYSHAVIYVCTMVLEDGTCSADAVYVNVLSREKYEPDTGKLDSLTEVVRTTTCFQPGDFMESLYELECEMSKKTSESCPLSSMPVATPFNVARFEGVWYSYAKLRGSSNVDSASFVVQATPEGNLNMLYRAARNGHCLSSLTLTLTPCENNNYCSADEGALRVVYTDYDHALLVQCYKMNEDSTCAAGHGIAYVYTRSAGASLTADAERPLIEAANEACLSEDDFVLTHHSVTCELRRVGCGVSDIPSQSDFDLGRFTGTWYTVARLKNTGEYESGVIRIRESSLYTFSILYTGAQDGECVEPQRYQMAPLEDRKHDWYITHGEYKGYMRVMTTDYETALVYVCEHILPDDSCASGADNVIAYSRAQEMPEASIRTMVEALYLACFTEEDFELVPREVHCDLDRAETACKVADLPAATNLQDTSQLNGLWFHTYSLRGSAAHESGIFEFEVQDNGDIKTYFTGSAEGQCLGTAAEVYQRTDSPNRWTSHLHHQTVVQLVYYNEGHAVLYQCDEVTEAGYCAADRVYLDVLSRTKEPFPSHVVTSMSKAVKQTCVQPGDFALGSHEVSCAIQKHPVYDCKLADLPAQHEFNPDKFTGRWYAVYRSRGGEVPDSMSSYVRVATDGTISVLYTGSKRGQCLSTARATYQQHPDHPADLVASYEEGQVRSRVMYTDYDYALMYDCTLELSDGTCAPDHLSVAAFSRTTSIPEATVDQMTAVLGDACMSPQDFEPVLHAVTCDIELTASDECQVADIPIEVNFEVQRFQGTWFSRFRLRGSGVWQSSVTHFQVLPNSNLRARNAHSSEGKCYEATAVLYNQKPGNWVLPLGEYQGDVRVVYTDYDTYALVYECGHVTEAGTCAADQVFVDLLARSLDAIPEDQLRMLRGTVRRVCTEPGDYDQVTNDVVCEVRGARSVRCRVDDLPRQDDFSMAKFTGTWHAVARLVGSTILDSGVSRIRLVDEATWSIIFTGALHGQCVPTQRGQATYREAGVPADLAVNFGDIRGRMRVMYTDYQSALVYECMRELEDGTCEAGQESLTVYSRDKHLADHTIDTLVPLANQACYSADDFELVPHQVLCSLATGTPAECKVRNIASEDNFHIDKYMGTWVSLYHLRGSHVLDSFVIHFERGADDKIRAYYSGVREGECEPTMMSDVANPQGHKAVWASQDQTGTPGVTKILYTDYLYSIVYVCDEILDDGSCATDKVYLDVMSRTRHTMDQTVVEKLGSIIKAACFEPGEFVPSDLSAVCELSRKTSDNCRLDDMPVAKNFDGNKFSGVWYSYAKFRGSTSVDSAVILIRVGRDGALTSILRTARNNVCSQAATVVLEPSQDPSVGDFTFKQDSGAGGRTRVLYTDYNAALVVDCSKVLADGTCASGHGTALVFSRSHSIPAASRRLLVKVANDACLSEDDFVLTMHSGDCELPFSGRRSCRYEDLIPAENFQTRDVYGTWHLLATTATETRYVSRTYKFYMGSDRNVRYSSVSQLRDGSCISFMSSMTPSDDLHATFTYEIQGHKGVTTVMLKNSQYMVTYDCTGGELDDRGVCPHGQEEVEIWGRSQVFNAEVKQTLIDATQPRTCVRVQDMADVTVSETCVLDVETCSIYAFVPAEEFASSQMAGGWQLLRRTTLVDLSIVSASTIYNQQGESDLTYALAGSLSTGQCETGTGTLHHHSQQMATFTASHDGVTSVSRVLYLDADYAITFECVGGPDEHGVCPLTSMELNIWSRHFEVDQETRRRLTQIAKDRTLGCVPTISILDVPINGNCEIPAEYCTLSHFQGPKDFDQRALYGTWHRKLRTTLYRTDVVTATVKYGHSADGSLTYSMAGSLNTGKCYSVESASRSLSNQPATYTTNFRGIHALIKYLYISPEHNILLYCRGGAAGDACPLDRLWLEVNSRDSGALDSDTSRRLLRIARERTLACVPTATMVGVMTNEECPTVPPEGRSSCRVEDINAQEDIDNNQMLGTWYQVASSLPGGAPMWDSAVLHVAWGGASHQFLDTQFSALMMPDRKCSAQERMKVYPQDDSSGHFLYSLSPEQNRTVWKILYMDANHFISYECMNSMLTEFGVCEVGHELLELYSRRRAINNREKQRLGRLVSELACVNAEDFHVANHTTQCRLDGVTDLGHFDSKSCRVDDYEAQEDFDADRFAGVWYEVERTRYAAGNLWEAGVFSFTTRAHGALTFTYAGSSGGQCLAALEVQAVPRSGIVTGDFTAWIGQQENYGSPWTMHMNYKVMYTDYDNVAIVYTCHAQNDDGTCRKDGEQVDLLTRSGDLDEVTKSRLYELTKQRLCVDVLELVEPADEVDCSGSVLPASASLAGGSRARGVTRQASHCRPVLCFTYCPHGFTKDQHGCEICECHWPSAGQGNGLEDSARSDSSDDDSSDVDSADVQCPQPMCANLCEDGYINDQSGCPTCQCDEPHTADHQYLCKLFVCRMHCAAGYQRDSHGCELCQCVDNEEKREPATATSFLQDILDFF